MRSGSESTDTHTIEDNDDTPVGRVLSRREVLTLLAGFGGAALLAACDLGPSGSATATLAPTQTSASAANPTAVSGQTPVNAEPAPAAASTPVEASPTADVAAVPDCVVRPELTE